MSSQGRSGPHPGHGAANELFSKDWNDWFDHRVAMLQLKFREAREDLRLIADSAGSREYNDDQRNRARQFLNNVEYNEGQLNAALRIVDELRQANDVNEPRIGAADLVVRDLERLEATDRLGGGEIMYVQGAPHMDYGYKGHSDASEVSPYIWERSAFRDSSRRDSTGRVHFDSRASYSDHSRPGPSDRSLSMSGPARPGPSRTGGQQGVAPGTPTDTSKGVRRWDKKDQEGHRMMSKGDRTDSEEKRNTSQDTDDDAPDDLLDDEVSSISKHSSDETNE